MYFIKRIFSLDLHRMKDIIGKIAKRSNKSPVLIFLDIVISAFCFGSGYMDYYVFNFEELSYRQRSTYITRTINNNYLKKMNNPGFYHIFNDKPTFLKTYQEYIKRDYVNLKECSYDDYQTFIAKHQVFVGKPIDGQCGYGVEVIDAHGKDIKELYDELKNHGQFLLEEKIVQDQKMSALYPCAINTIRIVTCLKDGQVHILFSALRIGNKGKVVDNFNNGGMFSVIDEDGVIRKPAIDKDGIVYDVHPYTGTPIVGFEIPHFAEMIELCKKMAYITPENGLTGWDICATDQGIDVVEGNQLPGYDIYQSKPHLNEDRLGIKPRFDAVINGRK